MRYVAKGLTRILKREKKLPISLWFDEAVDNMIEYRKIVYDQDSNTLNIYGEVDKGLEWDTSFRGYRDGVVAIVRYWLDKKWAIEKVLADEIEGKKLKAHILAGNNKK